MKVLNQFSALCLVAIMFTVFGCSNDADTHDDQQATATVLADTTATTVSDTVLFKFDFAVANIPSPVSLIQGINKANKAYDKGMLNEPGKANGLPSEFNKAVNLGIYNIDMAFAVVNNMGNDVLEYLKASMILGDGLGLKNTIASIVGKRAESNLSNKDSLFTLLDNIYTKSDDYLRTNHRVYVASLIFTGSWVEVLYLTSKMSDGSNAQAKKDLHQMVWEQRFHLGNIINLLKDYKGDNEYNMLINDLTEIHKLIVKIKDPSEMTDAKFKEISEKLTNLRTRLSN